MNEPGQAQRLRSNPHDGTGSTAINGFSTRQKTFIFQAASWPHLGRVARTRHKSAGRERARMSLFVVERDTPGFERRWRTQVGQDQREEGNK